MPELPDVEIFRRRLARTSLHRTIERVRVIDSQYVRRVGARKLSADLRGLSLEATSRHGKHLLVDLSDERLLTLHFGMTGWLAAGEGERRPESHIRLVVEFRDGHWLAMVDQRRLGHVSMADSVDDFLHELKLGPDALGVSAAELRELMTTSRASVKATLMDQSRIAGLGNVYTDEILYQARIHPTAPAAELDRAALGRLHRQLHRVAELAIERRADPRRVPHTWLLPNREEGAACPRGNGTIRRFSSGGRNGYWCPTCQRS